VEKLQYKKGSIMRLNLAKKILSDTFLLALKDNISLYYMFIVEVNESLTNDKYSFIFLNTE
jgi:hypothetical protein